MDAALLFPQLSIYYLFLNLKIEAPSGDNLTIVSPLVSVMLSNVLREIEIVK